MKKIVKKIFKPENKYHKILKELRDYTMIPSDIYQANLELVEKFSNIKGDVVECGTWKGGMIAGVSMLMGNERNYVLFDSFEGLPLVKEIDGVAAKKWQSDKDSAGYYDNCKASEEDAKKAMTIAGVDNYVINRGWFENTLPSFKLKNGIAILRMDADWYDSTITILNTMFSQVNKGGIIIIDDYYVWEGCTKAVHDFLSVNKRSEKIRSFKNVCYIIKE